MSTFQEQMTELTELMTEHLNHTMGHMPRNGQVIANRMKSLCVGIEQCHNALSEQVQRVLDQNNELLDKLEAASEARREALVVDEE